MKHEKEVLQVLTVPNLKKLASRCNVKHKSKIKKDDLIDLILKTKKCDFITKALDGKFDGKEQKNFMKLPKRVMVGAANYADVDVDGKDTKEKIVKKLTATRKGAIIGSVFGGLNILKVLSLPPDKDVPISSKAIAGAVSFTLPVAIGALMGKVIDT